MQKPRRVKAFRKKLPGGPVFSCICINKFLRGGPMLCPPSPSLHASMVWRSRQKKTLGINQDWDRDRFSWKGQNLFLNLSIIYVHVDCWYQITSTENRSTVETFMPTHFSSRFAFESCTRKISESFLKKNFSSSLLICFVPIFLRQLSFKLFACEFLN